MAVAAHVSKVSKDYSPYGYSVMESVGRRLVSSGGGSVEAANSSSFVIMVDDADIFIENVQIIGENTVAADNTNYLTIKVESMVSGGGSAVDHSATTTRAADNGALAADTFYKMKVGTPVVEVGRAVLVSVIKSVADDVSINSKALNVQVRYRRKA